MLNLGEAITFLNSFATGPLIVCGNPRSGTRMHANVLNAHPEILITDEFHGIDKLRRSSRNSARTTC